VTATATSSLQCASPASPALVDPHATTGIEVQAAFRFDAGAATFIRASVTQSAPPARHAGGGLRVLLVDDNLMNQVYGEALLEGLGFCVVIAADGAEAVQRWSTEPFDLVLMDCHMPVMDGFCAARSIRESEGGRGTRTPIVALTGCTGDDEHDDCINAGMDAVLHKPFDPDELIAFVNDSAPLRAMALHRAAVAALR